MTDRLPLLLALFTCPKPGQAKPSLFRVPVSISTAVNRSFDYANAGRGRAAPVHAPASPTPSTSAAGRPDAAHGQAGSARAGSTRLLPLACALAGARAYASV